MIKTVCLFHVPGHLHDSCVTAQKFGQIWLVDDTQTMFWVDQPAIEAVAKFASLVDDDDDNYSAWCRATQSVSGFGGDGGIRESGTAEFLAACREAEVLIEAAGGIQYAALVEMP